MLVIRKCRELDELRTCVALQKEVWNFSDAELVPLRMFVVAEKIGGQVIGAFDGETMIGFALALPAIRNGHPYLHSHMVGVREGYRNAGLGRRIKWFQRDDAISRGFELMEWTFDPLEIKNAYFNIERLGAVVRRFVLNQYGTTSSPLHGGMPTDRCVAEWWISSLNVEAVLTGQRPGSRPVEARIGVPVEIAQLRKEEPKRAREIQKSVSEQFVRHFERGLAVIGFERSETEGTYLLGPWQYE